MNLASINMRPPKRQGRIKQEEIVSAMEFDRDHGSIIVFNRDGSAIGIASTFQAKRLFESGNYFLRGTRKKCSGVYSRRQIEHSEFKPEGNIFPEIRKTDHAAVSTAVASYVSRIDSSRVDPRNMPGTHTLAEWLEIVKKYGNKCLRCLSSGADVELTKDHVVPASVGGTNYASNLQPLCRSCNSWKGAREIDFRGPLAYAAAVV